MSLSLTDAEYRLGWKVGSQCLIFSKSKEQWCVGTVVEISGEKKEEWMTIKYGLYGANLKSSKQMQRYSADIKPIPTDHPSQFKVGSLCHIYSDIVTQWLSGRVVSVYNDDEGEWLQVKYIENKVAKLCDIQRYSKDIKLVVDEQHDDAKTAKMKQMMRLSNQNDLQRFTELEQILIDQVMIQQRVQELGEEITQFYSPNKQAESKQTELVCLCVLTGGFAFFGDLIRFIKIPHRCEFMKVKSYSGVEQHDIKVMLDLNCDVENKSILIVEDLIDTGKTMKYLVNYLKSKKAKSVKIACLLRKDTPNVDPAFDLHIDWIGFPHVPDEWIVGYGIDYNQHYRHLPYVASIKKSVYSEQ
eukprot:CAMPEP_0202688390 /NCGR_PEP_ID=MMETSP1385-20130828/3909_1 /ASSEMBLY_ACC=CAM_ASM_000861 /TAXON_ID=933848 /ORGANISM="Elphidium margaritaceum" /LENGTH=356 /DNA_ID=CAMNT_0049343357 /DNA_START=33 /DNA_END=1103 /DNA_ORIENTATION=+